MTINFDVAPKDDQGRVILHQNDNYNVVLGEGTDVNYIVVNTSTGKEELFRYTLPEALKESEDMNHMLVSYSYLCSE